MPNGSLDKTTDAVSRDETAIAWLDGQANDRGAPTPAPGARKRVRSRLPASRAELEGEIAALPDRSRPDLLDRWGQLYGRKAPAKISRDLLVRSIAYRLQEEVHGGLTPATRRRLLRLAADLRWKGDAALGSQPRIKPGTRFVREWKGTLHQVTVTPSGFEWQNRPYRSLSEIARTITGTNWNGWTFFGAKRGTKGRAGTRIVTGGASEGRVASGEMPADGGTSASASLGRRRVASRVPADTDRFDRFAGRIPKTLDV